MKKISDILLPRAKKDHETLLRQIVTTAVVSALFILFLAGYGTYKVYSAYIVTHAQKEAVNISKAILEQEMDILLSPSSGGESRPTVDKRKLPILDRRIRSFIRHFDVARLDIFNAKGKIVYSTEKGEIGKNAHGNGRSIAALEGHTVSNLERMDDAAGSADLVETYIPIRNRGEKVVGGLAMHTDIGRYRKDIRNVVILSESVLTISLLLVFGSSLLLLRKGANRLRESQESLENMAVTDPLTGIFNRRLILARAGEEFTRMTRARVNSLSEGSLGFIMVDIDFFKSINDSYGHLAGDEILKELCSRITHVLRQYDLVGRYGGEEFLVILPNSGFEQTRGVAERIRVAARERHFVAEGEKIEVTVSAGIACAGIEERDFTAALKRADEGLYKAKESGRNRVAWV